MIKGTRLGPYEILDPIGAGGMGEVYTARDTRLDRTVAVKVLAEALAGDPERRQRFEREARVIASLSHPNICALHDVGTTTPDAGLPVAYLVMEYLDGETLAARLSRGALPVAEVVRIGVDMAMALDAAHRQHIVHRDLKPANVMLTRSGVKLLDFGLAKAVERGSAGSATLTTIAGAVTAPGTVFGTLPYMSPEQIEGRQTDARSDIFALGSVLYEMSAGRRAFAGESPAALASAILSTEPAPLMPPSLDRIVRTCLRKDPDRRWQSAHDVALQLRDIAESDTATAAVGTQTRRTVMPWLALAATIALVAAGLAWRAAPGFSRNDNAPGGVVRFTAPLPTDGYLAISVERPAFAISPDGRDLAYVGGIADGKSAVWRRPLSTETASVIPGTEGASSVFWSPDGRSIGFFAAGQLKRLTLGGGAAVKICDVRQGIGQTGTWGDGEILFAAVDGNQILRVPAAGGTPVPVATNSGTEPERVAWPSFLPDGRHFLYMAGRAANAGVIMLGSLDGPSREVLPIRSNAQYIDPGFIVYGQDGALLARRFDIASGAISGEPIAIADRVTQFLGTGLAQFSVSRSGAVLFHSGDTQSRIATFDQVGRELGVLRPPDTYEEIRLSEDGNDLLVDRREVTTGTYDVWRIELARGTESRVTSDPGSELNAVLARDGSMIFSSTRGGPPRVYRRSAAGVDEPLVPALPGLQTGADLSPDGKTVIYQQRAARGKFDLIAVSLADRHFAAFHQSDAEESGPRFSPDGKWVAFVSDLGGRRDVYLAPFPGPGPQRIVSPSGGAMPRWSADGSALFYVAGDGTVLSSTIRTAPALEIGAAKPLFTRGSRARWISFEPTRDGRFIAVEPVQFGAELPLHVILNWPALTAGRQ